MAPTLARTACRPRRSPNSAGWVTIAGLLILAALAFQPRAAPAQEFATGNYYWYVPEHEKQGRTTFYSQPNFTSGTVRVTRTQRFKLLGGQKGWGIIQFDYAGKAYVHLRILRNAAYDPAASDPWHEFERASVFMDEPSKVEARLKAPTSLNSQVTDSKTPSWKRYKDGWNLKPSATTQVTPEGGEGSPSATTASRPSVDKKPRSKYSLLPPIGSEPPRKDGAESGEAPSETAEKAVP